MSSLDLKLFKSFKKNTEWFDNNYQSLYEYDGRFIAICRESVVDSDNDYRSLIYRIKKLHDKSLYVTLVTRQGTMSPAK